MGGLASRIRDGIWADIGFQAHLILRPRMRVQPRLPLILLDGRAK